MARTTKIPAGYPTADIDRPTSTRGFGAHTFSLDEMQRRLPRPIFEAIQATIRSGEPLAAGLADEIADAMREWATEHGATHFTHWFHPLTGATAEKHDAFLTLNAEGRPLERFSGTQLVQAEPDASSFPSGGMRSTFEARGYTAWDPTSPAFLVFNERGATLTIPSVFVSYTGEALDTKTPLLRSMRELSRAAARILTLMGREGVRNVDSTLGWEQEYFLIRRDFYEERPDLEVAGRTVLGTAPPKGQQLEDHYFGAIDGVALEFMAEVEHACWALGIPIKTRHNEVAPHQYEAAPIFQSLNLATDQNQVLMDVMRRIARDRDLAVLFHEKPFAGVNGSGKHNNWSMADDTGRNLLDPGDNPDQNVEFLFFLCAVLRAVHRRADLLRAAIANAGNDHRLGANEAPPAIVSVFLGERLTQILEALREGKAAGAESASFIETGLAVLPGVRKDNTDRNRTSPFAFTGNKFEFRAVGSSQSTAMPMAFLNIAVTEALDAMGDMLEARLTPDISGDARNQLLLDIAREVYDEARPVVFNGNNYSKDWVKEATARGLPNRRDTPAALETLSDPDTQALFDHYGVLKPHEVEARKTVLLEKYGRMIHVEAIQLLRMVKQGALPAAYRQQAMMAEALTGAQQAGVTCDALKGELERYASMLQTSIEALNSLRRAVQVAPDEEHDPAAAARHCTDAVVPAMNDLREAVDTLERRTDDALWPFPSYHEMLFQ